MKGKFGGNPDPVCSMSLKQVIRMFIQNLGLRLENMNSPLPFQPTLFRLLNYSVKGCYRWDKLLNYSVKGCYRWDKLLNYSVKGCYR